VLQYKLYKKLLKYRRIFKRETELIDYRIDSVTEGTDAQAEVHVNLVIDNKEACTNT
jgi:hypothetical protein